MSGEEKTVIRRFNAVRLVSWNILKKGVRIRTMKLYVKPAIMVEEPIMFETAHSDPHSPSGHCYPNDPNGLGLGHLGCWPNPPGNWNN